ncbi:MAG: hypothetical protein K6G50_02440 [bacterium]|nr:hypothetical protein [bacterium]
MFVKFLKIAIAIIVAISLVSLAFSPEEETPITAGGSAVRTMFAKDMQKELSKGKLVVVDKDESDQYIQEDISTHDLAKALTFARLKSEVLEQPLYIENQKTFGKKEDSLAEVHPTDHKAWRELTILEMDLKDKYEKEHPQDIAGYREQKALDPDKTPQAMKEFIEEYPDSHMVAVALSHIEYCLCIAKKDPEAAIKIYNEIGNKFKDKPYLMKLLPEYKKRAETYLTSN